MTPEEIKLKVKSFKSEIAMFQEEIDVIRVRWRALRKQCSHPDKYKTSCMGESGTFCPDCEERT